MPRWRMGSGLGWVTAEYGMLPASTGERKQRDVTQGPGRRAHRRDPAADRPLAARRRRLLRAGRELDLPRLRRAAGRRRHAQRRRSPAPTSRSRWRASKLVAAGHDRALPADRLGRGDLLRDRRRRAAARPRLPRGLTGRGRRQRRHDRRGRAGRGAGDRRAHAAEPRPSRRAAGARRGGIARLRVLQDAAIAAAAGHEARPRDPQRPQGARVLARCCARTRSTRCPHEVELPPETGTTFAENALGKARAAAAAPAAWLSPTTRGSSPRRSAGAPASLGALRRRGRDRRGEPRQAAGGGAAPAARWPMSA